MRTAALYIGALCLAPIAATQAATVSTMIPAQPLAELRLAALPAMEREQWMAYLARSRAQMAADKAALEAEQPNPAGMPARPHGAPDGGMPLRRPAAYIGAMGSRRTHDYRLRRLREVGMTDDEIARLHSPIGLDLGARTAEETAVSIAAEIVQHHWGGSGRPLAATEGDIHVGHGHRPAGAAAPAVLA